MSNPKTVVKETLEVTIESDGDEIVLRQRRPSHAPAIIRFPKIYIGPVLDALQKAIKE